MPDRRGTGALESPPDPRDLHLSFIAGAAPPVKWAVPFMLAEPPDSDQRSADCCVGEATSYYHWQLTGRRFSVRSVFAYIAQPYGAIVRDGPQRVVEYGQETLQEAPDPDPKGAANMRSKAGLNPPDAFDDRELRYFDFPNSVEQVAQAVRDWQGCIFGLRGNDAGWVDRDNPRPPAPGEAEEWGHALYAFGYHMHGGLKCILAKSSWCRNGHHVHHIKENYFASGYAHRQAFVLVPKENLSMVRRFRFDDHGTLGVALKAEGAFGFEVYLAKNDEHLAHLMRDYEVPSDAPVITVP